MPSNTFEIMLRNRPTERIEADSVKQEMYKISFYVHHERELSTMEKLLDSVDTYSDKSSEKKIVRELIAEYALSQIVRWKKLPSQEVQNN